MDERKQMKIDINAENTILMALSIFRMQYKSGRNKTNVVKSIDKNFKNWYYKNDLKERGDFFDKRK